MSLLALFLGLLPLPASPLPALGFQQGPNLVKNGGFENGSNFWIPLAADPGTSATIDGTTSQAGSFSAQAKITGQTAPVAAGWLQPVPVQPGRHYLLSYAVKTAVTDLMAFPFLNYLDSSDSVVFTQSLFPSSGTRDWEVFHSRITIPAGVQTLDLFLLLYGTEGTAWFDAVRLTELTDPAPTDFSVDLGAAALGPIERFAGTNVGPRWPGNPNDMTAGFRKMGVDLVRTHDFFGPCDVHVIFPDFNADPLDPAAYDFASSDAVVAAILDAGSGVFFRLGESFEANPVHNQPPADFNKWAQVCVQIVKHYNAGWNQGFFDGIRYWEIWNEPDIAQFWAGTAAQYADLYRITAAKLKQFDPTLQVGGPALANLASEGFLDTFLTTVAASGAPLDFFSYHFYSSVNPWFYARAEARARELLTGHGFPAVPTFLTEWNNYSFDPQVLAELTRDDPLNAAMTAATLTYSQDSGLGRAFRYRTDEFWFGLFRDNGDFSYSGQVFRDMGRFRRTPARIPVTGGDQLGSTLLAGRSSGGGEVQLLVSDARSSASGYRVHFAGITGRSRWLYEIRRIDGGHEDVPVRSGILDANHADLQVEVAPPFVDFVRLKRLRARRPLPR